MATYVQLGLEVGHDLPLIGDPLADENGPDVRLHQGGVPHVADPARRLLEVPGVPHLNSRQLVPSRWQTTAFLLNIRVEARFFGRDILLWWRGGMSCLPRHLNMMPTMQAWIITPTMD